MLASHLRGLLLADPPSQAKCVSDRAQIMLAHTQSECFPADRRAVSSISKTDYILWRACAKNAWLRIHKPDVYYSTEVTEFEQSVMEMGIEVERVARGLFPDGVAITGSQTDGLDKTRSLIASKTRTLFQPVFKLGECLALIDVLQRELGTDEWSIYEVKSATNLKERIYLRSCVSSHASSKAWDRHQARLSHSAKCQLRPP